MGVRENNRLRKVFGISPEELPYSYPSNENFNLLLRREINRMKIPMKQVKIKPYK